MNDTLKEIWRIKWFLVGHIVVAAAVMVLVLVAKWLAPIAALWLMEMGQQKAKVPGSVKSTAKWLAMTKETIKPFVLVQWLVPGAFGAAAVLWVL